jgi:GNAT superfamily N-acetyltransferase
MTATTRPAVEEDIAMLCELMDEAVVELRSHRGGEVFEASLHAGRTHRQILEDALENVDTMVWCGLWESALVGYSIATIDAGDDPVVVLREIYTTTEARDVGVGEALVEAAIAWAIANEAHAIDAQTLPGARQSKNLFERFGLTARLITVRRELRGTQD